MTSHLAGRQGGLLERLDVLRWMRERNSSWHEWACKRAAGDGHLVLRWAQERRAPWDAGTGD
jgi:hypothetical protein